MHKNSVERLSVVGEDSRKFSGVENKARGVAED